MSEVKICKTLGDFIGCLKDLELGIELRGCGKNKELAMEALKAKAIKHGVNLLLLFTEYQWPCHIDALGIKLKIKK